MYTEQMTQQFLVGAPLQPVVLTATGNVNTGSIDMSKVRRALFHFQTGVWGGTAPTFSGILQVQESPDNSTWTNNPNIPTITINTASQQATVEIRDSQVSAGKRYVRLQIQATIGGTSPTIPAAGVALGTDGDEKPEKLNNDASLPAANQQVVN